MGELQPAQTVAAQANRHTGGRMRSERCTATTEDGAWAAERRKDTHIGQRYRLVTMEMVMTQPLSFKLAEK